MRNVLFVGTPFPRLLRYLTHDIKTFLKEESQLARSEMLEKLSCYAKNAVGLVIGGFVAYAGLIVLLIGIGLLIGFGIQKLGIDPLLAAFIGFVVIGFLIAMVGTIVALKGVKSISRSSLAPQKTLASLKHLTGQDRPKTPQAQPLEETPKPSADELQQRALATEERIGKELEEIGYRFSRRRFHEQSSEYLRTHPYSSGVVALAAGLLGSLLIGGSGRKR